MHRLSCAQAFVVFAADTDTVRVPNPGPTLPTRTTNTALEPDDNSEKQTRLHASISPDTRTTTTEKTVSGLAATWFRKSQGIPRPQGPRSDKDVAEKVSNRDRPLMWVLWSVRRSTATGMTNQQMCSVTTSCVVSCFEVKEGHRLCASGLLASETWAGWWD